MKRVSFSKDVQEYETFSHEVVLKKKFRRKEDYHFSGI